MPDSPQEDLSEKPEAKLSGLAAFWTELKRRRVMRVAFVYAGVAWLIIQIAASTFENFDIPVWAFRFVVIMLGIGFPVALIITWAFELTPEGIKTTKSAREGQGEKPVSKKQQRKRDWTAYAVGAALPTVIFGILAVVFYFQARRASDDLFEVTQTQLAIPERSIAVLPLDNFSPDPENAYFANGIHEEILTNLANISELMVIGRTSVNQYRNTVKTFQTIGQELGVRYLLEGSVQRDEDQAAITLQLVETETGAHAWARTYVRELENLITLRIAIAKDVAEELHAVLLPDESERVEKRPTENQEAYDTYLLAKTKRRPEKWPLLERAARLDSEFYDAWWDLAYSQASEYRWTTRGSDPELLEEAKRSLGEVRRLEPESGRTLELLGNFTFLTEDDPQKALSYGLRAKSLGVGGDEIGMRYLQLGRLEEARFHTEEALKVDPLNRSLLSQLYKTYLNLRLWDEARSVLEEMRDKFGEPRRPSRFDLIQLHDYLRYGDLDSYVAKRLEALESQDGNSAQIIKALIARDFRSALDAIEERTTLWFFLLGPPSPHYYTYLYLAPPELLAGLTWFALGEKDKWLEAAAEAKAILKSTYENSIMKEPDGWALAAICYALEGNRDEVDAMVTRVRERTRAPTRQYRYEAICEMFHAIAYLVLGDHEKAIDILEAAKQLHSPLLIHRELEFWFIFDALHSNPRFDALLKEG